MPEAEKEAVKRVGPQKQAAVKVNPKSVDTAISPPEFIAPTKIPAEIAMFSDPDFSPGNLNGGVVGGVSEGTVIGVAGGIIRTAGESSRRISPPLPPPPLSSKPAVTSGPVRVGGNVRPPRLVKYVPPQLSNPGEANQSARYRRTLSDGQQTRSCEGRAGHLGESASRAVGGAPVAL
jgi:hypothetical protein